MEYLDCANASGEMERTIDELLNLFGFTPTQTHFCYGGEHKQAVTHLAISDDLIKELIFEYGFRESVTQ